MKTYQKGQLIHEGKAKAVYEVVEDDQLTLLEFKDDLTAFNAQKKDHLKQKGQINRDISSIIFRYLTRHKISTHWVQDQEDIHMVCRSLKMIPVEVVVRNRWAGSTAKRLHFETGGVITPPLVELYYKKDEWEDPFINDEQALLLNICCEKNLKEIKNLARDINQLLLQFFKEIDIDLIDFKVEMGWDLEGKIILGDEISPDSCRLWDSHSQKIMDKDRFRQDLGEVIESYKEILSRIQKKES